jgi:hypothetical protein
VKLGSGENYEKQISRHSPAQEMRANFLVMTTWGGRRRVAELLMWVTLGNTSEGEINF